MTILITGGSGFIGSHVAEALLLQGRNVRALVRRSIDPGLAGRFALDQQIGDLLDRPSIARAVKGCDLVYHLAAELRMGQVHRSELFRVNQVGSRNLIEACREQGVRKLIYCSSVGVLGDIATPPAGEDWPPQPDDDYERSKLEGEQAALEAASEDFSVVVVRPAWVYGPRDRRTLKLFRMIRRGRMLMIGQGANLQHPVYVSDVVAGIIAAGEHVVPNQSIFHLAGPQIVSVRDLLTVSARLLGSRIVPLTIPLRVARTVAALTEPLFKSFGRESPLTRGKIGFFVKNRAYSFERARRLLGYQPQVDLEQGLRRTFAWYTENSMW